MTLKKPIEIIKAPIEVHGKICAIANKIGGGARSVEWIRATKDKDGYWIASNISIGKILEHTLDHPPLSDAEKAREGILSMDWMAEIERKDKKPSHIDLVKSFNDEFLQKVKDEEIDKAKASETKLQKVYRLLKYYLTEKQY